MSRSQVAAQVACAVFAVAGLTASSILLVDHLREASVFCAEGGGCDVVKQSAYSHLLGVPTPAFGVVFFIAALVFAALGARRLLLAAAVVGAAAALGFIGLQLFVLHAVCKHCMVADGAAIAVLLCVLAAGRAPAPGLTYRLVSASAGLSALAVPVLIVRLFHPTPPPLPPPSPDVPAVVIREERAGQLTIVEFTDFECPFCRTLHQTMTEVLRGYGTRVRTVRKHHPLAMHPHAVTAARAAICAEEAGAGDAMADALYAADPAELTAEGSERIAVKLGISLDAYQACQNSERPAARLAADASDAKQAGIGEQAPIFFVGRKRLLGAMPAVVLKNEIDRAIAGPTAPR